MVQAIISFGKEQERVVNTVKGIYGLKNKSDAVNLIIARFEETHLEKLKPTFVDAVTKAHREKHTAFSSIDELDKHLRRA